MQKWIKDFENKEKYQAPIGTFSQKAPLIVEKLLENSNQNKELALSKLFFYMNNTKGILGNKTEILKAKEMLEK